MIIAVGATLFSMINLISKYPTMTRPMIYCLLVYCGIKFSVCPTVCRCWQDVVNQCVLRDFDVFHPQPPMYKLGNDFTRAHYLVEHLQ